MSVLASRAVRALVAVPLLALAAGCSDSDPDAAAASSDRLQVVTTVAPITSIVANVAGDRVEVTGLVPEGTNSHTFEPPPGVARVLETADVVFTNGLQLEEPTLELARANAPESARIVELGTDVLPESEYIYDFSFPEEEGKPNPHLWTDPTYAVRYAERVAEVLSDRSPDDAPYFAANLEAFTVKANELADALRADQETIPGGKRELLTYHDAYAYFAETFGWEVIGAVQPANFEDPTPREVARIVDQVREREVPVVFGSEVFPSPILEQIGKETGARYEDTLRDDDLPGAPGDADHSWLGLMRGNYVTMITALGGTADRLMALDVGDVAPDEASYPQ